MSHCECQWPRDARFESKQATQTLVEAARRVLNLNLNSTVMVSELSVVCVSYTLMPPLPFDIIHTLVDLSAVGDLINFCSTCKALHHHLANDPLWKRLCASYGLRDFTHFSAISPFTIYTKLVYRYGPILGFWANDHPFRGHGVQALRRR